MRKDVTMLSGDHGTIAEEVCRQVGIAPDRCFARLLPQQKCDWIRSAQAKTPTQTPTPTSGQTYGDLDMVPNMEEAEAEAVGPDLEKAADPDPTTRPRPSGPIARAPLRVLMIGDGIGPPLAVSDPR